MFTSHILQRDKNKTVILIHGLFATSGFWLPALRYFPEHRIVLINVDYQRYLQTENALSLLDEYISQPKFGITGDVDVVGHSFGSVVTAMLSLHTGQRYHMCPVFLAQHALHDELLIELDGRLGTAVPATEVALAQMREATDISRLVDFEKIIMRNDRCLIPDNDRFFSYRKPIPCIEHKYYRGGHFDVVGPLSILFQSDYVKY
jgi:hypothetical protein